MTPPIPPNEAERLRTLQLYNILDTGAERAFDDLTRLAAAICETPMALITMVDHDRQWFKSRLGIDASETHRDFAFCAHAIAQHGLFVVEDASKDPRFQANPFVTSAPHVRFYAGAPLDVGGASLGTLCVIDQEPRRLSDRQREALRILGEAVVTQLELRRALASLRAAEHLLKMCAWCRAIKTEDGTWNRLDEYVMTTVPVTHGMCPDCEARLNPAGQPG